MRTMSVSIEDLQARHKLAKGPYLEFLRVPDMSLGIYEIPAGGEDLQKPHKEDEAYYVVSGKAKMTLDKEEIDVKAGDVIYVAKKVPHRFHSIVEDLAVLVFFAPAETVKGA